MLLRVSLSVIAAASFVAAPALARPSYVGVKGCKKCHLKQARAWKETKMAQAFETLKPNVAADAKKKAGLDPAKDYTTEAKCLKCHTTGYGEPGGYGSGGDDKYLEGVGCEMCHGPGSEFLKDGRMTNKSKDFKSADLAEFGFVNKPTEAQCTNCHNEQSPFYKPFNFAERKKQGTHEHFALKHEH